jgi:A/G-specific adenine glycosylase
MNPAGISDSLLAWYDRHQRVLPWRAPPGRTTPAYAVWLSEIMLQQTTVKAVIPYFQTFLARWPTVQDLASAPLDDVLKVWAGLGYYARARNLHACAKAVAARPDGRFPTSEAELLELPGIGPYTAAAIAAIAYDHPTTPVDGNVERVVARLFAVTEPLPGSKKRLNELARGLTPKQRAGDFAQASMDLGATICTPAKPRCILCPLSGPCRARALGIAEDLPAKAPKKDRPTRRGVVFFAIRADGCVLIRKRPEKGLLGGMAEFPTTDWRERAFAASEVTALAPAPAAWRTLPGMVRHTFTHFHLELTVASARIANPKGLDGLWVAIEKLGDEALPSVMRKVAVHALAHAGTRRG